MPRGQYVHKAVPFAPRFWKKVDKRGPNDCWPWLGSRKAPNGHGEIQAEGSKWKLLAHRVAWELVNGPVPDGLFVCHHCDNPPCCNPAHLFVGTQSDNMRDMVAKGRGPKPRSAETARTEVPA